MHPRNISESNKLSRITFTLSNCNQRKSENCILSAWWISQVSHLFPKMRSFYSNKTSIQTRAESFSVISKTFSKCICRLRVHKGVLLSPLFQVTLVLHAPLWEIWWLAQRAGVLCNKMWVSLKAYFGACSVSRVTKHHFGEHASNTGSLGVNQALTKGYFHLCIDCTKVFLN